VPLLPASLIEPLWVEFAALIGADERPEFVPTHPRGAAIVAASRTGWCSSTCWPRWCTAFGYERIATPGCSDRTIRRRLDDGGRARLPAPSCCGSRSPPTTG
jgi:hypothetical protein